MLYNEGYLAGGRGFGPVFFFSWTPPARTASALSLHGVGGNSADCRRLAERLAGIGCGTIVHMARAAGHPLPIVREAELQAVESFLAGHVRGSATV